MACGSCGKRRTTPPAGMGGKTQQQKQREDADKAARERLKSSRGVSQTFELQDRTGKIQTFGSRLQAEAAKVRAGGGTIKRK